MTEKQATKRPQQQDNQTNRQQPRPTEKDNGTQQNLSQQQTVKRESRASFISRLINHLLTFLYRLFVDVNLPQTTQDTIPYKEMRRDGIAVLPEKRYSKTIEFFDINYHLAKPDEQIRIFEAYSDILNYFDDTIDVQFSFINSFGNIEEIEKGMTIFTNRRKSKLHREFADMVKNQLEKGNNGLTKRKFLTFTIKAKDIKQAKTRLERIEIDIISNFKLLGVNRAYSLDGVERLSILYKQLNPESKHSLTFGYKDIAKTGLTTKDFIAPTSLDFRSLNCFRISDTYGSAYFMDVQANQLADTILKEIMEINASLGVNIHLKAVNQEDAIRQIKTKLTDIQRMKISEQKKAMAGGYDMDILPPDLITYEKEDILKNFLIQKYELDRESPDIYNSKLNVAVFFSLESKFERIANENKTKFAVGENISERVYDDISFVAFISAQVMILARLGSKAGVTKEDVLPNFKMIQNTLPKINTRDTILALGELTSIFAKEMFAEIEIEVKKIEREIKANELNIGMEAFKNDQKRDGNTATEQMGQDASFVSERIQPVGVPEISLQRGTPDPLPAHSESDGGIHQPIKQSTSERQDSETENAEQANTATGVGAGNEADRGNGKELGNTSDNREQIEIENENNKNSDNKVLIGTLEPFDAETHGKPWACTISRGRNFFTTKDGEPIGEFVGSNLVGGKVFVTNPQDGRIYGYGLRNKTDTTKSITEYAKYENGAFFPCDRNGNLLEVMAIDNVAEKITEEANKSTMETEKEPLNNENTEHEETDGTQEIEDSAYSKPDWKEFLEKCTKGIYAKQYHEPVVIIEFSESKYFGSYNNFLNSSGYEELSFTAADRKFKEVEAKSRAECVEKYGELSDYDKTYGAILYKGNPEDTELSVYNFRYDICDYDEQHSGLYNHINNFWKYQKEQAKITPMENRLYSDEELKSAEGLLKYLEPFSSNVRDSRLQQYFEKFPPHKETKSLGEKVLLPLLFEYNNLNRTGKRTYVTVEESIGKYQIYSGDGETDREKYAYIMTPANRLLNIGFLDYIKNSTLAKAEIEQRLDNIITYYIEQFEKMINQIEVFIPYDCATVMNRIDDVISINNPIMEAKRQK